MMPTKAKAFDFETYAIGQFEAISKKLDGLNTAFVPREEIMLMRSENLKTLGNLADTVAKHTALLADLKATDDKQQGAIDAKKSISSGMVAIVAAIGSVIGGIATGILVYLAVHK